MTTATMSPTEKFRQVYADAVLPDTGEEGCKRRSLRWHGERMPLAEAAELYAQIEDGYNEFLPDAIARLAAEFSNSGIEVTPARESSPVVYLHLPETMLPSRRHDVKRFVEQELAASEVDFVTKFTCLQDGEAEMEGEALRVWWD